MSDVDSLAQCCTHLASLATSDDLWKQLVEDFWPLLPPSLERWLCESAGCASLRPGLWRRFYRWRCSLLPFSCRHLIARMDEVEHLLGTAARGFAGDAAARAACCDRLSGCLLAIFFSCHVPSRAVGHSSSVLGHAIGAAWARRLTAVLYRPDDDVGRGQRHACAEELGRWTGDIIASLDEFYEPSVPRAKLQATLLRALRCASALTLLRDEIGAQRAGTGSTASLLLRDVLSPERVAEAVRSLEMEGFDVSVAPSLRPARGLPPSHGWWYAQTRQGYLGGVTNIR